MWAPALLGTGGNEHMHAPCVNTVTKMTSSPSARQSTMTTRTRVPANTAFDTAWTLFCRLHDAPSRASADELVLWLGEDPQHVRALDEALTLWALAGAALVKPVLEEARRADLQ